MKTRTADELRCRSVLVTCESQNGPRPRLSWSPVPECARTSSTRDEPPRGGHASRRIIPNTGALRSSFVPLKTRDRERGLHGPLAEVDWTKRRPSGRESNEL